MTRPGLAVVPSKPETPLEAARRMQDQAKVTADAAITELFDAMERAADACAGATGVDAISQGIRNEARIVGPQIRACLERMKVVRGRG